MKLSVLGEFGLIDRIRNISGRNTSSALIGIGDDAAVLKHSSSHVMLVTTDLLLEDVHFERSYTDYYSLGWKSAAVNLSDIAAMGGTPRFCLTALGIPGYVTAEHVLDFYRGFNTLLNNHKTALVGGDTCSSPDGLFVSVTAIGEAKSSLVVTRKGARPGDSIFVTGSLGDSAAGLEILQMRSAEGGMRNKNSKKRDAHSDRTLLVEKHLRPVPRVAEGRAIALSRCATAMIDISDGLSSDLFHICEQSRVGADIIADRIPLSSMLKNREGKLTKPVLDYALSGGEDYELLFTVPPARVKKVRSLDFPVTEIGTIKAGKRLSLVDSFGKRSPLRKSGHDHFRTPAGTHEGRLRTPRGERRG
jgi:thiamine-monophosphate kinase